jgi:hypothetical protein
VTRGKAAPLYVRVLRLKRVRPGSVMCFLLFEGVIGLAILLSLAELVSWWSVLVLPAIVAALVKINDIVAEAFTRADSTMRFTTRRYLGSARGSAVVPAARRHDREAEIPTEILPRATRKRATNQRPFSRGDGRSSGPRKKTW